MKTSYAAKRQGDFFAEARASPTPYVWSIYAVAGLVLLAVALYKLWQRSSSPQYARIVPSNDYDDLPDLIDTPPSPRLTHRLPSRSSDSEWQAIDPGAGDAGRRFTSNSVLELLIF